MHIAAAAIFADANVEAVVNTTPKRLPLPITTAMRIVIVIIL